MSFRHREARDDFSGGINLRDEAVLLKETESPNMMNTIVGKRGTIMTRPGTARLSPNPVSLPLRPGEGNPPVTSLYEYVNLSGVARLLAFAGRSLCSLNNQGAWVTITNQLTEHGYLEFITHALTNNVCFVNGVDGYWETNGITAGLITPFPTSFTGRVNTNGTAVTRVDGHPFDTTWVRGIMTINNVAYQVATITDANNMTLTATAGVQNNVTYVYTTETAISIGASALPSRAKYIAYYTHRVFLGNVEGFPDRVYFNVNDLIGNSIYNYFTAWSWVRASNQRGEPVTALKVFKNMLLIFTATTLRSFSGTAIANYVVTEISNSVGTVSQRSVYEQGENLYFMGADGVYIFNGRDEPFKISHRIDPIFGEVPLSYRERVNACAHNNRYYLTLPIIYRGETIV